MTDRHPDRQTEWNDNKAHSLRCERDATDRQTDRQTDDMRLQDRTLHCSASRGIKIYKGGKSSGCIRQVERKQE